MSTTAVRGYLRELRRQRHITQIDLAQSMGLALRTLLTWELGTIADIKSLPLARAIRVLGGSMDDVAALLLADNATADDGCQLAQQCVLCGDAMRPEQAWRPTGPVQLQVLSPQTAHLGALLADVMLPGVVRAGRRVYEGVLHATSRGRVPQVLLDGVDFRQVYQADTGCTPDTFTWGYPGVGATALARVWLHYECGIVAVPDGAHATIARATEAWVAALPHTQSGMQWTLESTELVTWVKLCMAMCRVRTSEPYSTGAFHAVR